MSRDITLHVKWVYKVLLCQVFSHSTPRVETGGLPVATMEEEFKPLREVIKTSQRKMKKKISESVAEMKRDVAEVQ